MTSCNYVLNGVLVTGSSNGEMISWNGNAMDKKVKAHSAPVWIVEPGHNNTTFYTGGHDGKIILWNPQF